MPWNVSSGSDARPLGLILILLALAIEPAAAQTVSSKPPRRSEFLTRPGETPSDPYGEGIDWSSLPEWRRSSFYGVRARGKFFVYVVDCSGSMADDFRLVRAKGELRRSIHAMRFPQQFQVIFYNDQAFALPAAPQTADRKGKLAVLNALNLVDADGPTDPRAAMKRALGIRPDAVFLVSDGEYPEGTAEFIARANPNRIPIHCIDLSGGAAGTDLRRIARDSGGQYATR